MINATNPSTIVLGANKAVALAHSHQPIANALDLTLQQLALQTVARGVEMESAQILDNAPIAAHSTLPRNALHLQRDAFSAGMENASLQPNLVLLALIIQPTLQHVPPKGAHGVDKEVANKISPALLALHFLMNQPAKHQFLDAIGVETENVQELDLAHYAALGQPAHHALKELDANGVRTVFAQSLASAQIAH